MKSQYPRGGLTACDNLKKNAIILGKCEVSNWGFMQKILFWKYGRGFSLISVVMEMLKSKRSSAVPSSSTPYAIKLLLLLFDPTTDSTTFLSLLMPNWVPLPEQFFFTTSLQVENSDVTVSATFSTCFCCKSISRCWLLIRSDFSSSTVSARCNC